MKREKYQTLIDKRIEEMQPGSIFVTSDFADIAPYAAINMALSRLEDSGSIRRILRGIYDKPRFSKLLNEFVAADPSKVAYAIARKNHWSIIPMGDTALNILRLSTQVPAVWQYVSDGPYKEYSYDNVHISFRRTSNKEATGYSYITGLVIQALRALGREHVDETVIRSLRESLPVEEKSILLKEAQGTTAWIFDFIKEICRGN
ncbi:MAG: hypothetical protein J5531_07805 [Lachnospiraceae bacterium]|nr:hypothetical protein [Lachnospiraceae bacterium]